MESRHPDSAVIKSPAESQQETRRHARSLLRGSFLVLVGVVLLLLFGLITAAVALLNPLILDIPITEAAQRINWPPANFLLEALSWPGFSPQNYVWPVLIIAGLGLILRRVVEAAFLFLATVANAACELVKLLVHRQRPTADLVHVIGNIHTYSFPSGHVCQYVLFFGFGFYLAFTLMKRGALRMLLLVLCGALVLLIGPSRIWMGQHWASDVLGSYTLATGLLLLIIWGYRWWEARRVAGQPLSAGAEGAEGTQGTGA